MIQSLSLVTEAVTWISEAPPWQAVVLIIIASAVAGKLLEVVSRYLLPRLAARTGTEIDEILVEELRVALYSTVLVGGAYLTLFALALPPIVQSPAQHVLESVLVVVWSYVLVQVGVKVSETAQENAAVGEGVLPILQNIWTLVVGVGGLFVILSLWKIDITPLLASAGIAGVAIGFAAKETVANFFGGIALYMDGTYAVGDFVVLDSNEEGWVEHISIRSTQIRTRDDLIVTVPNSMLNSGQVVNESTPTPRRRIRVPVGVGYDSDVEHVEDVLVDVAENLECVSDSQKPQARFREFGDSALQFELLVWIENPSLHPKVRHEVNKAVKKRLNVEGIEIPYPQRVVSHRDSGRGVGDT